LTVVSATSAPPFQPLRHQRNVLPRFSNKLWTALRDKHFQPQTGSIYLWISFALCPFAHKSRTTERCSWTVHPSSTVAILITETRLWTCACASAS
jgi:hypothetical protein